MSSSAALKGKLLSEGKTKQIYQHASNPNLVLIESKDRITAGDGVKSHEMKDKSEYSTRTNAAIFEYLNSVGVPTSFVSRVEGSSKAFIAKNCEMIPIEWVTRRLATGSFLRRHPNVKEGYRFAPIKLETFYKDDANHDPYWSLESIKEASFPNLDLSESDVERMCILTRLVFQLLERAWQTLNHSLVDMKVEFGKDKESGEILLSDVIDNDSWRLWPNGDKRLMLDKQVYRNLTEVDNESMEKIRSNFALVAERTENLFKSLVPSASTGPTAGSATKVVVPPQVGIVMGSSSDRKFVETILKSLEKFGINRVDVHVSSAHKSTEYTLEVIEKLNQWPSCKCIIAVAGRSNGLGLVAAANSTIPVINCPPMSDLTATTVDIWSSLRVPSGLGCTTALGADCAAMAAAHIVGNEDCFVWSKIKTAQTMTAIKLIADDCSS
uniref:Multifunctional protein ADE2 n=1 Tax=Aceria tosichella TaxID=561515 RepID=A0A6G1S5Z1_9ACAR